MGNSIGQRCVVSGWFSKPSPKSLPSSKNRWGIVNDASLTMHQRLFELGRLFGLFGHMSPLFLPPSLCSWPGCIQMQRVMCSICVYTCLSFCASGVGASFETLYRLEARRCVILVAGPGIDMLGLDFPFWGFKACFSNMEKSVQELLLWPSVTAREDFNEDVCVSICTLM